MKAKEYLDRISKVNPNFIKFFKGTKRKVEDFPVGCYSKGDLFVVAFYFRQYKFLTKTVPTLDFYVIENSKKKN